jgi:NADH-quinone oxidoreductase subunit G
MPQVTIDDKSIEYDGKPKLLQLCLDTGAELPHFCFHPSMSIPANCRQCLVEIGTPVRDRETGEFQVDDDGKPVIQFFPKLMTSCSVDVTDGMVVRTHRTSELVARAQRDNLELLLINHPLDCPICDQAGHCPLQIQAYKFGPEGSRFEFHKVHKPKRIQLGPRVVLDAERCINCTRCTRFTEEISGSNQLTIIERGVKNYPMTPPNTEFDEPYSMNVIDLCPVGALTSADFRFRARIWEMSSTPSISVNDARGSNVYYWVRDNQVLRITPRQNMDVNEYWLADEDRLVYATFNEDRPAGPKIGEKASTGTTDWEAAYDRAASILKNAGPNVLFLGSAYATVEDNYLLQKLAKAVGADAPRYIPEVEVGRGDDWLMTDDRTPNAQGCERLGMQPVDEAMIATRLKEGSIKAIYVLDGDPVKTGLFTVEDLAGVQVILHHYHDTNETLPAANVALPAAMAVETVGTYVNIDGHAQRVRPAKAIQTVNRNLMMEMGKSRQDQHGTPFDRWQNESHKIDCRPGWITLPAIADRLGHEMSYTAPAGIMEEIASKVAAFSGATYRSMGLQGVRLADVGEAV